MPHNEDSDMDLDSSPSPSNVPDPVLRPIRPTPPGELSLFVLRPTDACLKDLGRLSPGAALSLSVDSNGTTGTLVIGNGRRHAFSLGKQSGSELDVIQDTGSGGGGDCFGLGTILARLQIAATDDVYEQTRKAAVLANAEAKKKQAKELKSGSRQGAGGLAKAKSMVRKVESHPVPPSSSSSQALGGSAAQSGSGIAKRSIRQRIMQLLVLKSYSKAELLARLQADGLIPEDRSRIDSILQEIGCVRTSVHSQSGHPKYSLARAFYSQVMLDWPYYQAYDKQNVKRILESAASTNPTSGPAAGDDAPTARKRPSLKPPSAKGQKKPRNGLEPVPPSGAPSVHSTATLSPPQANSAPPVPPPETVMSRGRNTESTNGLDAVFGVAPPPPPPLPTVKVEDTSKSQEVTKVKVSKTVNKERKRERKEAKEAAAQKAQKADNLDVISDLLDKASGSAEKPASVTAVADKTKSVAAVESHKQSKSEKRHGATSDGRSKKKDKAKAASPKKADSSLNISTKEQPKVDVLSAQNGDKVLNGPINNVGQPVDSKNAESKKVAEKSPKGDHFSKPLNVDGRVDQNNMPSLAPCTLTIKERRKIEADFPTPIQSAEQRQNYSAEFKRDYAEYTQVYQKLSEVGRRFESYEQSLEGSPEGSEQYSRLEREIQSAYAELCRDSEFQETRQRHAYLRHKLQHLKTAVADFDKGL